jgi:hypothetical protein
MQYELTRHSASFYVYDKQNLTVPICGIVHNAAPLEG